MMVFDSTLDAEGINNLVAFKIGNRILDKWNCSVAQKISILGVSKSSYYRYRKSDTKISVKKEQLERLSYIVKIHGTLAAVFSNPDNVYGFMNMKNSNAYFNGRTPLEVISEGSFEVLHEVWKQIEVVRVGSS